MKPAPFAYHGARTTTEAVALLGEFRDGGRVLAGGQSLVPLMNFRLARPSHLIDINRVDELDYIRHTDGLIAIGARTRQAAAERSPLIREQAPLLAEALAWVGHEPIRHRGTVVGSIAHADPAAEIPAVALAMDGEVTAVSLRGERVIAAADFFRGPFLIALEPGELVTELRLRPWPPGTGYAFLEFARRHGDFAIAGAGVLLHLGPGGVERAAVVLCGVADTPVRARAAEDRLRGHPPTPEVLAAAADAAVADLTPPGDVHGSPEYRRTVARAYVRRALARALERARRGGRP